MAGSAALGRSQESSYAGPSIPRTIGMVWVPSKLALRPGMRKAACLGRSQQGSEAGGAEALASNGRSGALDRECGNALQRPSTWALGDSGHHCPPGTLEACPIRRRDPSELEVGITTGVKLRGPERSEGHVSFNGRVRWLSSRPVPGRE